MCAGSFLYISLMSQHVNSNADPMGVWSKFYAVRQACVLEACCPFTSACGYNPTDLVEGMRLLEF